MLAPLLVPAFAGAEGFHYPFDGTLKGWSRRFADRQNETVEADPEQPGKFLGRLHLSPSDPPQPDQPRQIVYLAQARIPVGGGMRYRVTTRCRTEIADGEAALICIFLKDNVALPYEKRSNILARLPGSNEWQELSCDINVPPEANAAIIQLALLGRDGTAWFDGIHIESVESPFSSYRVPEGPFLFAGTAQLSAAREKPLKYRWAKELKERILQNANRWTAPTDEEILALIPPNDAYYVYGVSRPLDPETGEQLKWAGWAHPFSLINEAGTRFPNERFPDLGHGYKGESGPPHYFVAYTHAERIKAFEQSILPALTTAYWITQDDCYATRALLILDAIASIYPSASSGPLDYPGLKPGIPGGGRLQRPYYQAARALVNYGYCYDLLSSSPAMEKPSGKGGALSIRQNILQNLIVNGGTYCYEQSIADRNLNNGTLDYNRGILIAGALAGIPHYIEHALYGHNGIQSAISNSIDLNGRYFETSSSYASHTSDLLVTTAYLIEGVNRGLPTPVPSLFNDLRLADFCIHHFSKVVMSGRMPYYGDAGPDRRIVTEDRWFDPLTYRNATSFLALSTNQEIRQIAMKQLAALLTGGTSADDLADEVNAQLNHYTGNAELRLLLEEALPTSSPTLSAGTATGPARSSLLDAAGLALFRHGAGASRERGVLFRLGPTCNHGQLDEFNLQFYAHGREFSADPGYFNHHFRFGFTRTTVAHNTVVVNRRNQLAAASAGGKVLSWFPGTDFTSLEADNPDCYRSEGVHRYQRRIAQVDRDGLHYLIDTFRVEGAHDLDYSFHAIHGGRIEPPAGWTPVHSGKGSLLSDSVNYNEELLPDGGLRSFTQKPFYWAAPGQGYGFLGNPVTYRPEGSITLEWIATDATGHRLDYRHFPPQGAELILAEAKGPENRLNLHYAITRVSNAQKRPQRFLSVIAPLDGPRDGAMEVREIVAIDAPDSEMAAALEITARDAEGSVTAHHLYANTVEGSANAIFDNGLALRGREAFIALDPEATPRLIAVTDGTLSYKGLTLTSRSPLSANFRIREVQNHPLRIRVDGETKAWTGLKGSAVSIEGEEFARPIVFQIEDITTGQSGVWLTLNADSNLQSRAVITSVQREDSSITTSSEFPRIHPHIDNYDPTTGDILRKTKDGFNGLFTGYTLTDTHSLTTGRIRRITEDRRTLTLDQLPAGVESDSNVVITAPAPGHRLRLLPWAQAERGAGGRWSVIGYGTLTER